MNRFFIYLLVIAILAVSCESENALTVINQEQSIDNYIKSTFPENEVVRSNGANKVIISEGAESVKVANGDSVTMLVEGYVFNNAPSTMFLQDSIKLAMNRNGMVRGLYDGLLGSSLYEQSLIIFSAEYGYYEEQVGVIPPMSALLYNVLITDIKKK